MTTLLGISSLPENHPLSLGFLGMHGWVHCNYAVHHSDLVVWIGMRLDDRACGKFAGFAPQARIVHIDIDPAEIQVEVLQSRDAWLQQSGGWREQYPPKRYPSDTPDLYQPQVIQAIDRATRGEAVIVPAAIGARMVRPDKQVWCVIGDGCFQMTLQELAVMAVHHVPFKIALLNNEYLGMVRQQQQVQYRGNLVEVDLAGGPDYLKLAQAYGVPAWRVREASQLDDALGVGMAYPGTAVIEFRFARAEDVYPWVLGGTSLGEVLPDTPYAHEREQPVPYRHPHSPVREPVFR